MAAALEETPGIEARYAELQTGDYLIEDRALFERKTMADFAASVIDGRETAKLMLYTAGQIDRVRGGWIGGAGYRPKGRRRQQLRVLQALPGIGPKRAAALPETFGSIRAIMAADSDDLAAVHGMGSVKAAKIENVLCEIPDGGVSRTKPP